MSVTLSIEFAAGVQAHVDPGATSDSPSFWFIDSVSLALPPSNAGYVTQDRLTVGGSCETGDELRFKLHTGILNSSFFRVPERNGDWTRWQSLVTSTPSRSGALTLLTRIPFTLRGTSIRVFAPDGSALLCMNEDVEPGAVDGNFGIAPGFQLFTSKHCYAGWCLRSPVERLCANEAELMSKDVTGERLNRTGGNEAQRLSTLFQLVNDDTMDQLYDGDANLGREVRRLRDDSARDADGIANRAIVAKLNDLLERWFPDGSQAPVRRNPPRIE